MSDGRIVVRRFCIWHRSDGSKATGNCSGAAGSDRFSFLGTRFAKVHVNIEEPRRYDEPGRIENRNPAVVRGSDGGILPVPYDNIRNRIHVPGGVVDFTTFNYEIH